MGNIEKLREIEKRTTNPEVAAIAREAIEAIESWLVYVHVAQPSEMYLDSSQIWQECRQANKGTAPMAALFNFEQCPDLSWLARDHSGMTVVLANGKAPALSAQPKLVT